VGMTGIFPHTTPDLFFHIAHEDGGIIFVLFSNVKRQTHQQHFYESLIIYETLTQKSAITILPLRLNCLQSLYSPG
jgi:hypothetical protein